MRLLPLLLAGLLVAAPVHAQQATETDIAHPGPADSGLSLGIDVTAVNPEVRPQDDFYRHVNGGWLERTEIPADQSNYGAFIELRDEAREHVRTIIEEASDGYHAGDPDAERIAAAYRSFLDVDRIEALGLAPIEADLERIDRVAGVEDLMIHFAESHRTLGTSPFRVGVGQDQRNAERYALMATQAGLGLPDRSYYLEDRFAEIRDAYVGYLTQLFELGGMEDPAASAENVLALETRLAEIQWSRVQNRDREATYNKVAVDDFAEAHPNLALDDMLDHLEVEVDSIIVRQPSYFEALDTMVSDESIETWQHWMRARLLDANANLLPADFREANFQFHGLTLAGQEEPRPRWHDGVDFAQDAVGEAIGRLYVEQHYPPVAEARMAEMVENLRAAFRSSITDLDWMSEATKVEALEKLERFNVKIGYPEEWRDYSSLDLSGDDLVGNARQLAAFRFQDGVDRLGGPVDRIRWGMTPQTVNAYYSPTMNEIVFPAAILQPPFFNVEADDAVNYGGIGAVIGHEFSHGFDDQGRRSDGHGNLRDWWTEEDAAEYVRRAEQIIDQYSDYEPLPGHNIIGAQTIGENIADLAGLTMAYRAYQQSLDGQEAPVIDGYTGDQRFFMGWAQIWRVLWRDARLQQQLQAGSHSPGEYRTNGIVQHLDAFHEAFDTQPGDTMYRAPEDRIRIW